MASGEGLRLARPLGSDSTSTSDDGLRLAVDGVFVVSGLLVGELFACGFLVGELFLDGLFVGELFIDRSAVIFCGFRVGRPVGVGLFGVGLFGVGFGLGLSRCVVDVVNLGGCVAVLGVAAFFTEPMQALAQAGIDARVYSGSWSQWSNTPGRPVATGDRP